MRASATLATLFLALSAGSASAGVTIHYEGKAADTAAITRMSDAVCEKAKQMDWPCKRISGEQIRQADPITARSLAKSEGSSDLSNASGVVVEPPGMCEPLYLVAGPSGRIDNFVKTQFAGAAVHVGVVELLEAAKDQITSLVVVDEGGYFESKSRAKLEAEMEGVNSAMAKIRREHPDAVGPVRRPDGRILDLVSKK